MSRAKTGGPAADMPTRPECHEITLGEEEIFEVSSATFYVRARSCQCASSGLLCYRASGRAIKFGFRCPRCVLPFWGHHSEITSLAFCRRASSRTHACFANHSWFGSAKRTVGAREEYRHIGEGAPIRFNARWNVATLAGHLVIKIPTALPPCCAGMPSCAFSVCIPRANQPQIAPPNCGSTC
jgi:hypothetical protein